jgi:hypothetical protein
VGHFCPPGSGSGSGYGSTHLIESRTNPDPDTGSETLSKNIIKMYEKQTDIIWSDHTVPGVLVPDRSSARESGAGAGLAAELRTEFRLGRGGGGGAAGDGIPEARDESRRWRYRGWLCT